MQHKEFGGSTAGRTRNCPGWHALAATLPKAPASEAANVGTALHAVVDDVLMERVDFSKLVGMEYAGVEITLEHVEKKVSPAIGAVNALMDRYDIDEFETEVEVVLPKHLDVGGTTDLLGLNVTARVALFVDFKFGDGVIVDAVDNDQLLHYTMCALSTPGYEDDLSKVDKLVLAIIQPTERSDEIVKVWEIDLERLAQFAREYGDAVSKASAALRQKVPPPVELLKTGKHCRFCPAEAICPAKTGLVARAQRLDLAVLKDLGEACDIADEMEEWIRAVRKLAHEQADRGDKVPGRKLVHKRATRKWNDPAEVEKIVKRSRKIKAAEAFTHTLLSPKQMEDLFRRNGVDFEKLETYVSSVSSGTTLVKESDPRPEAPAVAALSALANMAAG